MQTKYLANNWVSNGASQQQDNYHDNLMLRVLHQFKNGVQSFNKSSIHGNIRRPSQKKQHHSLLPQIPIKNLQTHKKLHKQLNNTLPFEKYDNEKTIERFETIQKLQKRQTYFRRNQQQIFTEKKELYQVKTTVRATTASSNKRLSILDEKKNWHRKKYGPVEMKGVVFRKKTQKNISQ